MTDKKDVLFMSEAELRAEVGMLRAEVVQHVCVEMHLREKLDALMLEFCPGEMTAEQIVEYWRHQKPAKPTNMGTCMTEERTVEANRTLAVEDAFADLADACRHRDRHLCCNEERTTAHKFCMSDGCPYLVGTAPSEWLIKAREAKKNG